MWKYLLKKHIPTISPILYKSVAPQMWTPRDASGTLHNVRPITHNPEGTPMNVSGPQKWDRKVGPMHFHCPKRGPSHQSDAGTYKYGPQKKTLRSVFYGVVHLIWAIRTVDWQTFSRAVALVLSMPDFAEAMAFAADSFMEAAASFVACIFSFLFQKSDLHAPNKHLRLQRLQGQVPFPLNRQDR